MVALDIGSVARTRFDHVGVQGALDEKSWSITTRTEFTRHSLEFTNEQFANDLSLALRVGHARQRVKETVLGLHMNQFDAELASERLFDLFALVLSHETGIDEHARQLRTNGLDDERGRNR